uniref:Uncharacterized protein n=1 Tax=Anguilla anguilla TaxID=7936 RepID=A0A0E9UN17_ANGAN
MLMATGIQCQFVFVFYLYSDHLLNTRVTHATEAVSVNDHIIPQAQGKSDMMMSLNNSLLWGPVPSYAGKFQKTL